MIVSRKKKVKEMSCGKKSRKLKTRRLQKPVTPENKIKKKNKI